MEWMKGDLLDIAAIEQCNCVAFTANSVLKDTNDGLALVMGAGAAKRIRDAIKGIDLKLGDIVSAHTEHVTGDKATKGVQPNFYCVGVQDKLSVIALQVKCDWKDEGDFDLTKKSLEKLKENLLAQPHLKTVLNCPLIGHGGFNSVDDKKKVKAMVEDILQNVDIIVCVLD